MRTRIKICGITRPEDALAAAEAGADAIGLVFWPGSPRQVDIARAQSICLALPPFVSTVGLFLDPQESWVEEVLRQVPLDLLQFHGNEAPLECARYGWPYIKAIGMKGDVDAVRHAERYPDAQGFLLDSHRLGEAGGTGKTFDWSVVPELPRPVILAGGLNADNVAEAVRVVRPWAVDVSSGVEVEPGIKDPALMRRFVSEVAKADE